MKKETFEEFKVRLQKQYPVMPLKEVQKGNDIYLWGYGERGIDGTIGEIIVGIYKKKQEEQSK